MSKKTKANESHASGVLTAVALKDTTTLHGKASAEFIKAYTGVDNELNVNLERGLKDISKYRVNPDFANNNIQQQAGYSAEVAHVARENAKNILEGNPERIARTEDVADFGSNHQVTDHVKTLDGKVIENSGSQMKFVSSLDTQLKNIAEGQGGGKKDHSRYMAGDLTLPSDQVEKAKEICASKAESLHKQADTLDSLGNKELAAQKRKAAENYEQLRDNKIKPASLSSDEAVEYRTSPTWSTVKDIGRVSHRSGMTGAQFGAALGGGISTVTNLIQVYAGQKDIESAVKDISVATGKAAASGYLMGFGGAAISASMRQSSSAAVRGLAGSNVPAMIVTTCTQLSGSVRRLISEEIDITDFLEEIGQSGTNILAGSGFAVAGQTVIPIPVVGAVIGSMVGYTLSNIFYQETLNSFKAAKASRQNLEQVEQFCLVAKKRMDEETALIKKHFEEEAIKQRRSVSQLFSGLDEAFDKNDAEEVLKVALNFCDELGYNSMVKSKKDLDSLIESNATLRL